jgi:alkylation response protein AidB-like acyl-CoA dehydrogenase
MSFFTPEVTSLIRSHAPGSELSGTLHREVLNIIYAERLFKLFVPAALNGAAKDLPTAARIFEEASYIDGSFGWLITIGSGGGYFATVFAPEEAVLFFSPHDAVVAGSGHLGTAQKAEGGYSISGRWQYCSGADYATIFTANCTLPDGRVRSVTLSPDQVQIRRDWDAYGLKATSSHTMSVADAYVPESRLFDIADGKRNYADPVYEYPFIQFAQVSFAAVNIGICKHFFEEALTALESHRVSGNETRYNFVHQLIERQQCLLTDAADYYYDALQRSWELLLRDGTIDEDTLDDVSHCAKNAATIALLTAQRVYPYMGLSVTMEHSAINRCWRDLHTASQHILLKTFE